MLSFAQAKIKVARTVGGANDADELKVAGDGLIRALKVWDRSNVWSYLEIDNSADVLLATKTVNASPVVVLPTGVTYPNFVNVYVGTRVSGAGIPAGTTVLTKTSNSALVLSANATASADPVTLTFSGPIPVRSGVQDYALPAPFRRIGFAHLVNSGRQLGYVRERYHARMVSAPSLEDSIPYAYTMFNTQGNPDANNILPATVGVIRLFGIPSITDDLVVDYHRHVNIPVNDLSGGDEGMLLDVPSEYEHVILEGGMYFYLNDKDSENARMVEHKQEFYAELAAAKSDDSQVPDEEPRLIPVAEYGRSGYRNDDGW